MNEETTVSKSGLTEEQAARSRREYGSNRLEAPRRKSLFRKILSGLGDPIIRILIGALAINFVFLFKTFDIYETVGILAAILAATVISALSERGGEIAFEKMMEQASQSTCTVRRDGVYQRIPTHEIVRGDIIRVESGMKIPADGILVEGRVTTDQSMLNGESEECEKTPVLSVPHVFSPQAHGQLFRGTVVRAGEGIMLALRVGSASLYGSMGAELAGAREKSPLKRRLEKLAGQLSAVGYGAAVLVALSYLVNQFLLDSGGRVTVALALLRDPSFVLPQLIHALMLATTVIVVAVPEGLPMMISVVLSRNVRRMRRDRVLVRSSVGIETAGSLNLLFCDKTGTLTAGKIAVDGILLPYQDQAVPVPSLRGTPRLYNIYERSARYNTASVVAGGHAEGGNATDRALLASVLPFRNKSKPTLGEKVAFDATRKFSSVVIDGVRYWKGAPEVLLPRCTLCLDERGETVPFYDRPRVHAQLKRAACRGIRVVAIAVESGIGFSFFCLVLMRDRLRRETPQAVRQLTEAGIGVVMITGDNVDTARDIAKACGILETRPTVLESRALAEMDDGALVRLLPELGVLARALPGDKSRLVRIARGAGYTVGMTGDGVNDAPALKSADVGFAMGSGTEIAKEAGDIVITDDNIGSITRAVLYGRTIFKSIRKFILFQITTNLVAVAVTTLSPLMGIDTPITVLQMLWINMIMDTLGSLAFAGEAPLPSYLKEKPKQRGEGIMNRYMVWRIALTGVYMTALCLWFLKAPLVRALLGGDRAILQSAFFAMFIFADLSNFATARTSGYNLFEGLAGNRRFMLIFALIAAVQIAMIYFGGTVFRTTPLRFDQLSFAILCASSVLPIGMLIKLFLRLLFGKGRRGL